MPFESVKYLLLSFKSSIDNLAILMDVIIIATVLVYDIKLMSLNRKDFIYLDAIELV